ncbi:uncharacterized protein LOC131405252 [Diceros bicornis minor]|uniref:uncharacterized protein LOC131405252 n=1 Tax=Diceros bicornis minor TaxID=77932 RepID=UPI0026EC62AA|nr:uncharacterized protein LOC131405252 [Diceros bicornis minor]
MVPLRSGPGAGTAAAAEDRQSRPESGRRGHVGHVDAQTNFIVSFPVVQEQTAPGKRGRVCLPAGPAWGAVPPAGPGTRPRSPSPPRQQQPSLRTRPSLTASRSAHPSARGRRPCSPRVSADSATGSPGAGSPRPYPAHTHAPTLTCAHRHSRLHTRTRTAAVPPLGLGSPSLTFELSVSSGSLGLLEESELLLFEALPDPGDGGGRQTARPAEWERLARRTDDRHTDEGGCGRGRGLVRGESTERPGLEEGDGEAPSPRCGAAEGPGVSRPAPEAARHSVTGVAHVSEGSPGGFRRIAKARVKEHFQSSRKAQSREKSGVRVRTASGRRSETLGVSSERLTRSEETAPGAAGIGQNLGKAAAVVAERGVCWLSK